MPETLSGLRGPKPDYIDRIIRESIRWPGFKGLGSVVYLAGPVEKDPTFGVSWRTEAQEKLLAAQFAVLNPIDLETGLSKELGIHLPTIHDMKSQNLEKFRWYFNWIIELDMAAVNRSNAIIVKSEGERTAGTIHEVGDAFMHNKTVVLVSSLPASEHLSWFLACTDGPICKDFDEAVSVLKEIFERD